MTLEDEISQAVKSNSAIIGYRESIKFIKTNSPNRVVVAKNAPENLIKEIQHNA